MKKFVQLYFLFFTIHFLYSSYDASPSNQQLFEGKVIVITGGTGYLGQAIMVELLKYNPQKIVIFSRDEVKHFKLAIPFNSNPVIHSIIGDVRDYERVLQATRGAHIVIHAAALKRIDMMEHNVEEVIKTNILGSLNVFKACIANNVEKAIFISTDKACSPVNAYGACKFLSEKIFTNYDPSQVPTCFVVARYGNVLESTGSIIPIIIDRINAGQEILLTDPDMTRFIINKHQAVELIFDALRYGVGGEIFVKKLPAFKLTDLIEILKYKFNASNPVKITGLRPGEKIHEALVNESEALRTIEFQDYFIICSSIAYAASNALYIQKGTSFRKDLPHFTSDQAVISQEEVIHLFKQLGLL